MPIWVTLTPEQIARADEVGKKRQENRLRVGAVNRNNKPTNAVADLADHIFGARCELASHIGLETKSWLDFAETLGRKRADLDGFIEVRGRKESRHNLIVQYTDPPEWAYVTVCAALHPDYSIDAWCWGWQVQQDKYKRSLVPGRPAYVISPADMMMKSAYELKQLVLTRASA